MPFVRLLGLALLLHELLYIFRDGRDYLARCFLPVLGLQLGARAHALLHLSLVGASLWLTIGPDQPLAAEACLALLSLVIASYSLRLSNHLVLGWFMLVVVCLAHARDQPALARVGTQVLVVSTYLFAFMHKLNRDYMCLEQSCAAQLASFYCWDRGFDDPRAVRLLSRFAIGSTLLCEAAIPLLLLSPATCIVAVLIGLLFHFGLALLGIVNFSAMMYAGLLAFVDAESIEVAQATLRLAPALTALACTAFMLLAWFATPRHANRHCPYRFRAPATVVQLLFGALTACLLLGLARSWATAQALASAWRSLDRLDCLLLGVLTVSFWLNGLAPYLGWKTEFSFAMFSNLRHEPWRHLVFPARLRPLQFARYVELEGIEGLPTPEQLDGDSAALLAWTCLSEPKRYHFSRYFLREAVRRIQRACAVPPVLRLRLIRDGKLHEIEARDGELVAAELQSVSAVLFPFVFPVDSEAPHSEQGAILRSGQKQLF